MWTVTVTEPTDGSRFREKRDERVSDRQYEAMAYYYDNMDEIQEYSREQADTRQNLNEESLTPKEIAE